MTAREMMPAVGQTALLLIENFSIPVRVADVKHVYGRPRFLVRPLAGNGEQWVEISRLTLPETTTAITAA